jgi:hypothetical protein
MRGTSELPADSTIDEKLNAIRRLVTNLQQQVDNTNDRLSALINEVREAIKDETGKREAATRATLDKLAKVTGGGRSICCRSYAF